MKIFGRIVMLSAAAVVTVGLSGCVDDNGANGNGGGGGSVESVVIGGKKWMKENLNVKTNESWCYGEGGKVFVGFDDDGRDIFKTLSSSEIQANCNKYGRLYTWAAAKKACQSIGWRLPSRADWDHLAQSVGGTKDVGDGFGDSYRWNDAGGKLKSKSGWDDICEKRGDDGECSEWVSGNGTDNFDFSALPGGVRNPDGSYYYVGKYGFWWTATEYGNGSAYDLYMRSEVDWVDVFLNVFDPVKSAGISVRCIKD